MLVNPMTGNVSALFRATFGVAPGVVASAPGRVNLIGEHTDYNGGPVLPVATAERTSVAVGPAEEGVLELISTHDGTRARIDWRAGRPAGWTAYLAGVMRELEAAGAAPARAAGAGVARQLARTLAAAPQARPGRAAPFACVARRGRDGADPVRRAAPDAGPPAAIWGIAVRGPRVVSASVRMQRPRARSGGRRGATGRRVGRAAHRCGLGRRGARTAREGGKGKGERRSQRYSGDPARVQGSVWTRTVHHPV